MEKYWKLSIFIILIPTPDSPHFYCMLGGNLGSLMYRDVSVMKRLGQLVYCWKQACDGRKALVKRQKYCSTANRVLCMSERIRGQVSWFRLTWWELGGYLLHRQEMLAKGRDSWCNTLQHGQRIIAVHRCQPRWFFSQNPMTTTCDYFHASCKKIRKYMKISKEKKNT